MRIATAGGVITRAERNAEGFLQVYASFLMEGPLDYFRGGKKVTEMLPWEYVSDSASLATAPGKPLTLGHPPVKDHWIKDSDFKKYGLGMTGNIIYLERPFAVIACLIGDKKLADDIEAGHIQQVSSCRKNKGMIDTRTGQRYQGAWQANHLAFVDKRTGRKGRSGGAWVLSKGQLPSIDDHGNISVDSVPGLNYDIPDYSTFVLTDQAGGALIYAPAENDRTTESSLAASRRIILQTEFLADDTEDSMEELTPEQLAAIGISLGAALAPAFEKMTTGIIDAVKPDPIVADDVVVFTAEEKAAAEKIAEANGRQKGRLWALVEAYPVADSAPLKPDATVRELCAHILKALKPEVSADSYDDNELPGFVQGVASSWVAPVAAKPAPAEKFRGKVIPAVVADEKDPEDKAPTQMDAQRKAMQVAHARR
jgi:hypothetical protein